MKCAVVKTIDPETSKPVYKASRGLSDRRYPFKDYLTRVSGRGFLVRTPGRSRYRAEDFLNRGPGFPVPGRCRALYYGEIPGFSGSREPDRGSTGAGISGTGGRGFRYRVEDPRCRSRLGPILCVILRCFPGFGNRTGALLGPGFPIPEPKISGVGPGWVRFYAGI